MLPAERCQVGQESVRDHLATAAQRVERAAEIDCVPQRDGRRDESQAACAMLLGVEGAIAQSAETMEANGAGERIAGLALVQGRRRLPPE